MIKLLSSSKWKQLILFTVAVLLIPQILPSDYYFLILNIIALNAIVVLGLNLLIGFAGQISLGHAAFYGLGAYISGILTASYGWPIFLSIPVAVLTTAIVGLLVGIPTLKLEGHYLVMATLGFNIIVSIILVQWDAMTGGPSGLAGIPYLKAFSISIDSDRKFYYLVWAVLGVLFCLSLNLIDSRVGRALRAIGEDPISASALGIPVERYKVGIFVVSALYAAVAGSLYAHYVTFISPKTFDFFYSIEVVTMVVVGGIGSLWSGLAGAAILTMLPEILEIVKEYNVLVYGAVLMAVLVFFPEGLLPGIKKLWQKRQGQVHE